MAGKKIVKRKHDHATKSNDRPSETSNPKESLSTDLFVDAPPDDSDDDLSSVEAQSDSEDLTDSEDSEYSGLEDEDDSDDEESVESFEEGATSEEETSPEPILKPKKMQQRKIAKVAKNSTGSDSKDDSKASTSNEATKPDEYAYDSSDEEDIRNTVGNIPMEWYKDHDHIGYDLDGKKIMKPAQGDQLDEFINKMEDPNYWRTVKDSMTGQNVVLSDKDVELIQKMNKGKTLAPNTEEYAPWVDFFTHETRIHPVTNHPAAKASFVPSQWERLKVAKMVHSIKMGWRKPRKDPEPTEDNKYYMLWDKDDQSEISKRLQHYIPAPKMALPGHAESYNPPPEYLFSDKEKENWEGQEPEDRKLNFIPQKYSSLRLVPGYDRFINERFERCLDLYLCPRTRRMRMNVDPEELLPKLPKPRDLRPFPTVQSEVYRGHEGLIRSISPDPTGQWFVSGSDDKTVKFWEISTGRCMKTLPVGGAVKSVAWNPSTSLCLVAVAVEDLVYFINPELGDTLVISNTLNMITSYEKPEDGKDTAESFCEWSECDAKQRKLGILLKIKHRHKLSQVAWHSRGDYLSIVSPEGQSLSVLIHQLSKRRTQKPFSKPKGLVQKVLFHPTRPFLFVATQRYVRVYNLLKQEATKKLVTNSKWVSSLAVHPGGDNVIVGSYDCRLSWFDMDLSTLPYKTLRHQKKAIRQVCYHRKYPLFASASDDGTIVVCHGMVYSDLLQNPLIVPVKILRGHAVPKNIGVLDCVFHPTQPWIFSSGADHTIRLYT